MTKRQRKAKPSRKGTGKVARRAARHAGRRSPAVAKPGPPPAADTSDIDDLASRLRRQRQALGQAVQSSREYWAGVHRLLELRSELAQAEGRFRESTTSSRSRSSCSTAR